MTDNFDVDALNRLISETTMLLRKGAVVTRKPGSVTVQSMPHENDDLPPFTTKVDLVLVTVGVLPIAHERRGELVRLLKGYPDPERLAGGPSYIELGGVLGDQGLALALIALGHVLKLWEAITPALLGVTGAEAQEMAGLGFVMISGFKHENDLATPSTLSPALR